MYRSSIFLPLPWPRRYWPIKTSGRLWSNFGYRRGLKPQRPFMKMAQLFKIRSLAFGGDQITEALAQDMSVKKNEAEQLKIKANYGADAQRLAKCAAIFVQS